MTYLRQSHGGPNITKGSELIPENNDDNNQIDRFMRGEIDKFNKLKR